MPVSCRLGMFPVRIVINFLGSDLMRKDSKKSISFVITILPCRFRQFGKLTVLCLILIRQFERMY